MDENPPAGAPIEMGNAADVVGLLSRLVSDCVKLIDLDGHVLRWNPACEDALGWSQQDVIGQKLPFIAEKDRLRTLSFIRSVAAGGAVIETDLQAIRKDGSPIPMRCALIPVKDIDGHAFAVLAIAAEPPVIAQSLVTGADGVSCARLADELIRGPLTVITGHAGLLARTGTARDERASESIAAITRAAEEVRRLAEDLRMLAQLDDERCEPVRVPVDVGGLLFDISASLPQDSVLLDFDPHGGTVLGDPSQLRIALRSCLAEAARTSAPGFPAQVSLREDSVTVTLEIAAMIDPAVGSARAAIEPGREGPGLALVRKVVSAHRGEVRLTAPGGRRVLFRLELPKEVR